VLVCVALEENRYRDIKGVISNFLRVTVTGDTDECGINWWWQRQVVSLTTPENATIAQKRESTNAGDIAAPISFLIPHR
jgi:hypothetical protein